MTYVGKKPADIIATAVDTTTGTFSGDLTVDTSTLYVDSANSRVGVGTASPSRDFQVDSTNNRVAKLHHTDGDYAFIVFEDNNTSDDGRVRVGAYGNDLQLYAGGSARVLVDSNGHVTMPAQPAFLVQLTSNITNLTINADTTVTFGTEIFDQNSDFASNTFNAPITGKYQLSLQIRFNELDVDGTFYEVKIFTSNREYRNIIDMRPFDADVPNYTDIFTILADMDAGDTANVKVKPYNSGASQADIVAAHTYFSGFLAC